MADTSNITVKINSEALNKVISDCAKPEYINAGLRAFALWVQGEVQEKAPHVTGALQSSTVIDDPEYLHTEINKRGDVITSDKMPDARFQVRQAIEYAKEVFERNGSPTGDPKILLKSGTNKSMFIEKFKKGFMDAAGIHDEKEPING
ncbi:MAG: hypothetical protein WC440_02200 [Candidatus Omnitrophota bacterium]|jgi:hypothetical protein